MNQELQSSLPSEEQKQIANTFYDLFPSDAPKVGSIQSLEKPSCDKNQCIKEEVNAKSPKKGKRGGQELKFVNRGHWSTEQNKKYHWFLEIHYKHFVNRHMRRTDKIFKTMQIFIGTRQAEQCRSHHQKMEKKYQNFISIVSNLREIHYSTQDTDLLQQQLEANHISIVENLASIQQLKAYKKHEDETGPLPLKKLGSIKSPKQEKLMQTLQSIQFQSNLQLVQIAEQQKQRDIQENCEPMNMFDQSRINFGQMLMYHEKQDNSGIFQSIFQN